MAVEKRKCILCDFDGTLIEEDLERSFLKFLLDCRELRFRLLVVAALTLPVNCLRNRLGFGSLLKSWTFVLGKNPDRYVSKFIDGFTFHTKKKTFKLISGLEYDRFIILSACDERLLIPFLSKNNIVPFDEIIAGKANGLRVIRHPYAKEKCRYVDRSNYNIGIANDCSDRFYLDMCDEKHYV